MHNSEKLKISVNKIQQEKEEIPSYFAQWELNDVTYYMSGKIEEKEIKKILEQMKF